MAGLRGEKLTDLLEAPPPEPRFINEPLYPSSLPDLGIGLGVRIVGSSVGAVVGSLAPQLVELALGEPSRAARHAPGGHRVTRRKERLLVKHLPAQWG